MYYKPDELVKAFGIPENEESMALLVMGYPADDASPASGHKASKLLSDFVKYE